MGYSMGMEDGEMKEYRMTKEQMTKFAALTIRFRDNPTMAAKLRTAVTGRNTDGTYCVYVEPTDEFAADAAEAMK